tara:strand:- start:12797 stop:14569 length:1773 start_codon:yes stop_codon:yes gene_type:complete
LIKKIYSLLSKKAKIQTYFLFVALFFRSILDAAGVGMIVPFISMIIAPDEFLQNEYVISTMAYLEISDYSNLVIISCLALTLFFLLKNIISSLLAYLIARVIFINRAIVQKNLFLRYLNAPMTFHSNINTAELDRNIKFEVTKLFEYFRHFFTCVSSGLIALAILITLALVSLESVIFLGLIVGVFGLLFVKVIGNRSAEYGKIFTEAQLDINKSLDEGLKSVLELKLYNLENLFAEKLFLHAKEHSRAHWKQETIAVVPPLFFELVSIISLTVLIIFFNSLGRDLAEYIPIFAMFAFALVRLVPNVTLILQAYQRMLYASEGVKVIFNEFNSFDEDIYSEEELNEKFSFSKIEFKNVDFKYRTSTKNIFTNLECSIYKGEKVGIAGVSGSGKSTFLSLFLGMIDPDNGKIFINDENFELFKKSFRSDIGYVQQLITLLDDSIQENVIFGRLNKLQNNTDQVLSVLKKSKIYDFCNTLDEGIDTMIGENGVRLSGGQRQRIGLARSLFLNPDIIILDEATSALDSSTEKQIMEDILSLDSKTIIFSTHKLRILEKFDKILFFEPKGRVLSGKFDELMKTSEEFKNLVKNN